MTDNARHTIDDFRRGDKVVTTRGARGTVASFGRASGRIYVRMEPYGSERSYEPNSLRHVEEVER